MQLPTLLGVFIGFGARTGPEGFESIDTGVLHVSGRDQVLCSTSCSVQVCLAMRQTDRRGRGQDEAALDRGLGRNRHRAEGTLLSGSSDPRGSPRQSPCHEARRVWDCWQSRAPSHGLRDRCSDQSQGVGRIWGTCRVGALARSLSRAAGNCRRVCGWGCRAGTPHALFEFRG